MRRHARFTFVVLALLTALSTLGLADAFASNGPGWP
jgi:hypothetical protein